MLIGFVWNPRKRQSYSDRRPGVSQGCDPGQINNKDAGANFLGWRNYFTAEFLWWLWWLRWQSSCLQCRRLGFDPWVRKIPWRKEWQPTSVFLSGNSHGWRSLVGYSPWGHKESDTTERLHFTSLHEPEMSPSTLHEFIHPHNSSRAGITIISTFHMGKLSHVKVKHLERNVDTVFKISIMK